MLKRKEQEETKQKKRNQIKRPTPVEVHAA